MFSLAWGVEVPTVVSEDVVQNGNKDGGKAEGVRCDVREFISV